MAKVKDQVYDGTEEAYTDADGKTHYFGELFRQTLTDSYPLPSLNPTGVARKSPRVSKPPSRGVGSADQYKWRACFKECIDRWNEMPDTCGEIGQCPTRTSKKNVWDAKELQGVMCSYFDLYMGCCLSSCISIDVSGPGGIAFTGGTLPENDSCWPCQPDCGQSTLEIEYTTLQMRVGEEQALSARNMIGDEEVVCCPTGDYSWEITQGSGMLEPDSGPSVVYIAPDFNVSCQENPTIKLTDCCGKEAYLTIAVNAYLLPDPGYAKKDADECRYRREEGQCCCYCSYMDMSCEGVFLDYSMHHTCCDPWFYCPPPMGNQPCINLTCDDIIDERTPEMIALGCCPELFL